MAVMTDFRNEPMTNFALPENAAAMREALAKVEAEAGRTYPLVIDGRRVMLPTTFSSINPCEKDQALGSFSKASAKEAEAAVASAENAFWSWRNFPWEERAGLLFRAAGIMRRRKQELSATMVLEAAKNWAEADGDTAEAIDFLEFYGREALRYGGPQPLTPMAGTYNTLQYIPLGVGAVIPPWNFPLAILTGMTTAAVVAGNTVVLKPASDTPLIAWKFMEVMEEAGLPPGVINFLTGPGSLAGNVLVEHPKTRFIAFTGSMEVGIGINQKAAQIAKGQIWLKRTILEMGGKDAMIIDSDCDLEEASKAVVAAAFGFQGQKCSACSRVIIDQTVYEKFLGLLKAKIDPLTVGPTKDPANYMGAVINAGSLETTLGYVKKGVEEGGRLLSGGEKAPGNGFFMRPALIADVERNATIAQEEIFAPVLAAVKAKDFNDALEIANGTLFGLTGGVFTRSAERIAKAKREFHVGNLYVNRKCTGALVGVEPFGGFNMSGTDSKAGGRDYLALFTQGKSISEKVG